MTSTFDACYTRCNSTEKKSVYGRDIQTLAADLIKGQQRVFSMKEVIKITAILVVLFLCNTESSPAGAVLNVQDSSICGADMELVWERTVGKNPQQDELYPQILPFGRDYWIALTYYKSGDHSDEITRYENILLDPGGNQIWRKHKYGKLSGLGSGIVAVGNRSYVNITDVADFKVRHIWFDTNGNITNTYSTDAGREYLVSHAPLEVEGDAVHDTVSYCREGHCSVERLVLTEKGVDDNGWKTVLRWKYPSGSSPGVEYHPARVGDSYLFVYKKEPKEEKKREWRLIRFSPENGTIISDSEFKFSKNTPSILTDKGVFGFILWGDQGKGTFIRLDGLGREIDRKTYDHGIKDNFYVSSQLNAPFNGGWLVELMIPDTPDFSRWQLFLRLDSDGRPLWSYRLDTHKLKLIGSSSDALFLAKQNTIYMCREKRSVINNEPESLYIQRSDILGE